MLTLNSQAVTDGTDPQPFTEVVGCKRTSPTTVECPAEVSGEVFIYIGLGTAEDEAHDGDYVSVDLGEARIFTEVRGGSGDDTLAVRSGAQVWIRGGGGADRLLSEDHVVSNGLTHDVWGDGGRDTLHAVSGRLHGGWGADTLAVSRVGTVRGNKGDDLLIGSDFADIVKGGSGKDTILGGADDDLIRPGSDTDLVFAGSGDDRVRALDGSDDDLRCGGGQDRAVIDTSDRTSRCKRIA